MKPKRILVPMDFSPCAYAAFEHALNLAKNHESEVFLLHGITTGLGDLIPRKKNEEHLNELMNGILEQLSELTERAREQSVTVHQAVSHGRKPVKMILEQIDKLDADLLVLGTHGRTGLSHLLMGSVAEELVRIAPCPVVTVRHTEKPRHQRPVRKIVVPLDFSGFTRASFEKALVLASFHKAALKLVHIIHSPGPGMDLFTEVHPEMEAHYRRNLEVLGETVENFHLKVSNDILTGSISKTLVNYLEREDADLVVMATHGQGGLNHKILGSTTERVCRLSPCPVYTMKPRVGGLGASL